MNCDGKHKNLSDFGTSLSVLRQCGKFQRKWHPLHVERNSDVLLVALTNDNLLYLLPSTEI